MTEIELRRIDVEIAKLLAETSRLNAETSRINDSMDEERARLRAGIAKIERGSRLYPLIVLTTGAGAALLVAALRTFGG